MTTMTASFTNPTTGASYRLVVQDGGWRITKRIFTEESVRLIHLRGRCGQDDVDELALARLVNGEGGESRTASDPHKTFAAVVLDDLALTADLLVATASEAEQAYTHGRSGFRPRCPALRHQRDEMLGRITAECRGMARAWQTSGLVVAEPLPDWLLAALVEMMETAPKG